jgi:hypothetical protein
VPRARRAAHWDVGLVPGRSWSDHDRSLREDLHGTGESLRGLLIYYCTIKRQSKDLAAELEVIGIAAQGAGGVTEVGFRFAFEGLRRARLNSGLKWRTKIRDNNNGTLVRQLH